MNCADRLSTAFGCSRANRTECRTICRMKRGLSSALNSGGAVEQPVPTSASTAATSSREYRIALTPFPKWLRSGFGLRPLVLARGLAAAKTEQVKPGQCVHAVGDESHAAVAQEDVHSAGVTATGPRRI